MSMGYVIGIQTYYKGYNDIQLHENVMKFITQAYQGKHEVIKNETDYNEQITKVAAVNIGKLPKRRSFKNDKLIYKDEYNGLIEVIPYLKGCFDILDNECEDKVEFIRTQNHCELRVETSKYKVIITKLDFYSREKIEIYSI